MIKKGVDAINNKLMLGETVKFFFDEYGGALTVASRLYNGLEKLDTFKNNKLFSDINKGISIATIGYDIYNKYKRFRDDHKPAERTFYDDQIDFIYPLMKVEYRGGYTRTSHTINQCTLDWLMDNLAECEFVTGLYDLKELCEIDYGEVLKKHFSYQFAIRFEYGEYVFMFEVERDTKKGNKFLTLYYDDNCGMRDLRKLTSKLEVLYLESLGYDKKIIRYDGQTPTVSPRSEPIDVELETINIDSFKHEVAMVLNNGERRGVLLAGNPGTGKSTVLLKLEQELLDYPIVYTTAKNFHNSECIDNFDNFISSLDKCVVFIEDMDAMDLSVKSEKVAALLTLLDGVRRDNAVVFIATINDASLITESIARTGRFDEVIEVHEPKRNDIIHNVLRFNWVKYNRSDEGFPCSVKDISWLTYFRMKRHNLTQSDYSAIVQKIHMMGHKVNDTTLISTMKEVVKSKAVLQKYKDMHKGDK